MSQLKAGDNVGSSRSTSESLAKDGKTLAKGGVIVVVGTLLAQGCGFAATLLIARAIGPDLFGIYTLALSVITTISAISLFGLNTTIVRYIPVYVGERNYSSVKGALLSSFLIVAFSGFVIALWLIVAAPFVATQLFNDSRLINPIRILALSIPLSAISELGAAATRGLKVMHYDALIKIATPLLRLVTWCIIIFLFSNLLLGAVYSTLVAAVITTIISVFVVYRAFRNIAFRDTPIQWEFRTLIEYSLPLFLVSIMYAISPRLDRLILGGLSDTYIVGIYSVAASMKMILQLLHRSIVKAFAPIIADTYNRTSVRRASELYITVTHWDAQITFILVVGAILFGPEVISIVGNEYSDAYLPFLILAATTYIGTLPGPTGMFLQMTNRQRVEVLNAALFIIVGSFLQIVMIYIFGWIGVAVGLLLTALMLNIIQSYEIYHFYQFHPFQKTFVIFAITSILTIVAIIPIALYASLPMRIGLMGLIVGIMFVWLYSRREEKDIQLLLAIIPFARK